MTQESAYITIVDDDPDDREFLCAGMQRCFPNVTVMAFGKGSELLTYLDTCKDKELPAAMILDYKMPGLTGADLLRNTGKGTPYSSICKVVWSTSRLSKEIDECLALGALRWLVKPSTNDELDSAIKSLPSAIFRRIANKTTPLHIAPAPGR
jgi:CheY-like chemotaxis protein